jgi:carbamoyltransferase
LDSKQIICTYYDTEDELPLATVHAMQGRTKKVGGSFQDRAEFGSRALELRSIICDARSEEMQSLVNLRIKCRESFRLFAQPTLIGH